MVATLLKLTRLSTIYILGDLTNKAGAFLLFLVIARFLPSSEYGIIGLTLSLRLFMVALLSFGIRGAIIRFYYQFDDEASRKRFYGSLWLFLILVPGSIVLLLLMRPGEILFARLFVQVAYDPFIRLTVIIAFLNVAFVEFLLTLFRAREQALAYVLVNFFVFATASLLTLWYVVVRQEGAVGYIYAQLLAYLLVSIVSTVILFKHITININLHQIKPALLFGLPLVPHFLSHWALGVSDRIILERHVSLEDLGIYSLGYQFGMAYSLIVTSMNNAIAPMFSRAAKQTQELRLLSRVATYYLTAILVIGLGITMVSGDIIRLFLPSAYHHARYIVPWIVLGYAWMGVYYLPMNTLAMTIGKTSAVPLMTIAAAFVNIGLNLIFVPRFGIMAAAINTVIGYVLLTILIFVLSQSSQPMGYEYQRISKVVLTVVALFVIGQRLRQFQPALNLIIGTLILLLFPVVLTTVGFWNEQEKQYLAGLQNRFFF